MQKFVVNDVGRAMTSDQMAEYREACVEESSGGLNRRMAWAANISIFILASLSASWILYSLLA